MSLNPRKRPNSPLGDDIHPTKKSSVYLGDKADHAEKPFVWKKKLEQQRKSGHVPTPDSERRRIRDLHEELAEAQRQRVLRDAERAKRQADAAQQARLLEQNGNAHQYQQDANFEGTQHFARQAIRLRQHRPVRADVLAQVVRIDLHDLYDVATTPHSTAVGPSASNSLSPVPFPSSGDDMIALIDKFSEQELEDVLGAVDEELDFVSDFPTDLDTSSFNTSTRLNFWKSVHFIVSKRLQRCKDGIPQGVHTSVVGDLDNLLSGKSLEKLREMKNEIESRLKPDSAFENPGPFGEVDFWTAALNRIEITLEEDRLKNITEMLLSERDRRTKASQQTKPPLGDSFFRNRAQNDIEGEMVRNEAAKGMAENEEAFADEVSVPSGAQASSNSDAKVGTSRYTANDKYRPRKPRYFNRVHTGYNWSKYNRTHYDHDNPPPKMVQGYMFNIFYPDLIDPSKSPTYTTTRTENPDVSIITFRAGPPYQDIAFKIVNRPWERSHRRGFRSSFDRGVLQLWFHFQRYRYRR